MGRFVAEEVCRLLESDLSPVRGPLKTTLANANLTLQKPRSIRELESIAESGPNWAERKRSDNGRHLEGGENRSPRTFQAPGFRMAIWKRPHIGRHQRRGR